MYARRGIQCPGDEIAVLLENSVVKLLARQLSQRPRAEVLLEEKMKRLLQGPASELSLSQNHHHRLSPLEIETDAFVCGGIKGKATSTAFSVSQERSSGVRVASDGEMNSVGLNWEGFNPVPSSPVQQNRGRASAPDGGGQSKSPEGQDVTALSFRPGWRGTADERGGLGPTSKPPTHTSCSLGPKDRSADVIDFIVKELQGISRIQTEIAELQQHLTLIKGSVDEVSSCVDAVLSEIEGLQSNSSPSGKASPGPKTRAPRKEPILYFYGIPEQEDENTKELVCSFLSEYHCFNGIRCSDYIKDATRAGTATSKPLSPRPAVVRLVSTEQRDFILRKSILLQSAGVTVVADGEQSPQKGQGGLGAQLDRLSSSYQSQNNGRTLSLRGGAVRTEGDGQLQVDSCQVQDGSASQAVHCPGDSLRCHPSSTLAKKSNLIAELEEKVGRVVQMISSSEPTLKQSSPDTHVLDTSPKPKDGPEPKNHEGNSWPSPERLDLVSQASGPVSEADTTAKDIPSTLEVDRAGGQTPEGSETDCDITTLEFISPEQVSFVEEAPVAVITPGYDGAVHKLVGGSEALKDMVQIDLSEQDPTDQVFRDVLENSQYFLEHSRDNIDLVDMRFYTNKLGKALNHFRSALQVVFHKLETGDPEVLLEGDKSFHMGPEPAPALCSSSMHSSLENVVEIPPSQSSGSQANVSVSSENMGSVQRDLPVVPLPLEEVPDSGPVDILDLESAAGQPLSSEEAQEISSSDPQQPNGYRPMSLEKVCAETIYLNKCINNFKNVLKEKRQMRRKLLKDLAQEASWTSSAEELHSGRN
ncbi:UNVERIFIED_CONTAM: hypothetical protein K2H54_068290 [Gekko kuhli]